MTKQNRQPATEGANVAAANTALTIIQGLAIDEPDQWPRYRQNIRLEGEVDGQWQECSTFTTCGHGLNEAVVPVTVSKARIQIERE